MIFQLLDGILFLFRSTNMKLVLEIEILGLLVVAGNPEQGFTEENANKLALLNQPFALALTNCLCFRELMALSDRLADDNRYYMVRTAASDRAGNYPSRAGHDRGKDRRSAGSVETAGPQPGNA
jgi:hypothetical protein